MMSQALAAKRVCPICGEFARYSYAGIVRHIGQVHSFDADFHVVCGLGPTKCPATYTNFQSYRSHVYKKHREELVSATDHEAEDDISLTTSSALYSHDGGTTVSKCNTCTCNLYLEESKIIFL